MMAEGYGPSSCSSVFVPKSKLLHNPKVQYGLVPKLSHHGGKNSENREQSRACNIYIGTTGF